MDFPIWITNFKNYQAATSEDAVRLAMVHDEVAHATGKHLAVAVNAIDLASVASIANIATLSQHVDAIDYGSRTGHIHPAVVKSNGAWATLLNHSEHRLEPDVIKATIAKCQAAGLKTIVCAESPAEIQLFASFEPDMLAYEPPELIGSADCSVATKPDCIRESLKFAGDIPLLVGAGVSTTEDVKISLELGAKGFLVASAIVKAADPKAKLMEMAAVL